MIAVPLEVRGEHRGVLGVVSAQPDALIQDDLSFLQIVAWCVDVVTQCAQAAEEMVQEAIEPTKIMAVDELVAVLAYDFRNYITPIKARVEL